MAADDCMGNGRRRNADKEKTKRGMTRAIGVELQPYYDNKGKRKKR